MGSCGEGSHRIFEKCARYRPYGRYRKTYVYISGGDFFILVGIDDNIDDYLKDRYERTHVLILRNLTAKKCSDAFDEVCCLNLIKVIFLHKI